MITHGLTLKTKKTEKVFGRLQRCSEPRCSPGLLGQREGRLAGWWQDTGGKIAYTGMRSTVCTRTVGTRIPVWQLKTEATGDRTRLPSIMQELEPRFILLGLSEWTLTRDK